MMDTRNSKVNFTKKKIPAARWYEHVEVDNRVDTLIVWTESTGVDMALSFQEADGCAAIWYVRLRPRAACM